MSGSFARRLSAVEARAAPSRRVFRFQPDNLDEAELATWYEAEEVSAQAAGMHLTVYHWSTAPDTDARHQ